MAHYHLLAIRRESERLQQLVELAQVAHRHVRLQIGQRIAFIEVQTSGTSTPEPVSGVLMLGGLTGLGLLARRKKSV